MRRLESQSGQAMLETILFISLVLLALLFGMKAAERGYASRTDEVVDYYAFPFP